MTMATYIRARSAAPPTRLPYGQYSHKIRWETNGRDGYIIQHINRYQHYVDPPANIFETEDYWEAWRVDEYGAIYPNVGHASPWHDEYSCSAAKPGTYVPRTQNSKGEFRFKGTVYWCSRSRFVEIEWTKNVQNRNGAGILLSRSTRPTVFLGVPMLIRRETGEWDATANPAIAHRERPVFGRVNCGPRPD